MKNHQSMILLLLFSCTLAAQEYTNPVIRGFNPDPSVCRVGEDYYVVTSSFEYAPGIPIYHSKDLVNWELIGHVLNRKSQIDYEGFKASEGVYAPTIRYYNGTFYVVTSIVRNPPPPKNIIMTAKSPEGPWSDPIVLTDSLLWHIDPSLFFDDDGKCYFVANRRHQVSQPYSCYREIAVQELDLNAMKVKEFLNISEGKRIGDNGECIMTWKSISFEADLIRTIFEREDPAPPDYKKPCMIIEVISDTEGKIFKIDKRWDYCG